MVLTYQAWWENHIPTLSFFPYLISKLVFYPLECRRWNVDAFAAYFEPLENHLRDEIEAIWEWECVLLTKLDKEHHLDGQSWIKTKFYSLLKLQHIRFMNYDRHWFYLKNHAKKSLDGSNQRNNLIFELRACIAVQNDVSH
jgi:hypothetical protein